MRIGWLIHPPQTAARPPSTFFPRLAHRGLTGGGGAGNAQPAGQPGVPPAEPRPRAAVPLIEPDAAADAGAPYPHALPLEYGLRAPAARPPRHGAALLSPRDRQRAASPRPVGFLLRRRHRLRLRARPGGRPAGRAATGGHLRGALQHGAAPIGRRAHGRRLRLLPGGGRAAPRAAGLLAAARRVLHPGGAPPGRAARL